MKSANKKFDTPLEELELMEGFAGTAQFEIISKWAKRYIDVLKSSAFSLLEDDPSFVIKHASYTGQAFGIEKFLEFIRKASEGAKDDGKLE